MIAIRNQNSGPAFVLASIIATYPDADFSKNIKILLDDENLSTGLGETTQKNLLSLKARLADIIDDPTQLDDLRSDYIDRFDRGKQVTSLYETEYGRERAMVKGNELSDIAGFYRAFGFETGGEGVQPEMIDHVAVELEFYALLAFKNSVLVDSGDDEGVGIVLDARQKFLKDHLGRFIGALCERPGLAESPFYKAAFEYCRDLVLDECKVLNVVLEPVPWLSGQTEVPDMSCGGSVGCLK